MRKKLLGLIFAVVLLGSISSSAGAAIIKLDYEEILYGVTVQRTIGNSTNSTTAGLFHFKVVSGGTFSVPYTNLYTFCIEPLEYVTTGSVDYEVKALKDAPSNVTGGMGDTKANLLRELYGTYFPVNTSNIAPAKAAALQIATWEIVRETGDTLNVYNGNVRFNTSSYATLAQDYLDYITENQGTMRTDIMAAVKNGVQDAWIPVPEPSTLGLLGLGFVLVGTFACCRHRSRLGVF